MQKARVSREEIMSTIQESSHVFCEELSHHSHLQSDCYYVHHLYTMASSSTVITTTTTTITTACSGQLRRRRSRRWIINKLLEFALQCGLALLGPFFRKNAAHEYSAVSPPPWTVVVFGISILVTLCAGIGSGALRGLRGPPSFLTDFLHFVMFFSAISAFASLVSTALGGAMLVDLLRVRLFPFGLGLPPSAPTTAASPKNLMQSSDRSTENWLARAESPRQPRLNKLYYKRKPGVSSG